MLLYAQKTSSATHHFGRCMLTITTPDIGKHWQDITTNKGTVTSAKEVLRKFDLLDLVPTTIAYDHNKFKPHMVAIFKSFKDKPLRDWLDSWIMNKMCYRICVDLSRIDNPINIGILDDGVNRQGPCGYTAIKEGPQPVDVYVPETVMIHRSLFPLVKGDDRRTLQGIGEAITKALDTKSDWAIFQDKEAFPKSEKIHKFVERLKRRIKAAPDSEPFRYINSHYNSIFQGRRRLGFQELHVGLLINDRDVGNRHAIIYFC